MYVVLLQKTVDPAEVFVHSGVDPWVTLSGTVHAEAGDANHTPRTLRVNM
jgi:hypothetical protein